MLYRIKNDYSFPVVPQNLHYSGNEAKHLEQKTFRKNFPCGTPIWSRFSVFLITILIVTSLDSSVLIVMGYRLDDQSLIPVRGKISFSSLQHPQRF
jgi:hypothetical protein